MQAQACPTLLAPPKDLLRGAKVRFVDHLAVEAQCAGIGIACERRDDFLCPDALCVGRLERRIDDIDMLDQRLGRKAGFSPLIATALLAWAGTYWPVSLYIIGLSIITIIATSMTPETARDDLKG